MNESKVFKYKLATCVRLSAENSSEKLKTNPQFEQPSKMPLVLHFNSQAYTLDLSVLQVFFANESISRF